MSPRSLAPCEELCAQQCFQQGKERKRKKKTTHNFSLVQRTGRKEKAELHLISREEWIIYFSQEQEE